MEISEESFVDVDYDVCNFDSVTDREECEGKLGHHSVQLPIDHMLPVDFKVYVNNNIVVNHSVPGFESRILPTFNHYTGPNGGYMALYSYNENDAIYSVGDGEEGEIYVIGQVRVPGEYNGRVFVPEKGIDLHEICEQYFSEVEGEYWFGGDTGGWFGIQEYNIYLKWREPLEMVEIPADDLVFQRKVYS